MQPRRRVRPDVMASPGGEVRRALSERRLELGLTQVELADLAGVSRAALQRLELGAAETRFETLNLVAEALGCHLVVVDSRGTAIVGTDGR